jgi:hypothetical protein
MGRPTSTVYGHARLTVGQRQLCLLMSSLDNPKGTQLLLIAASSEATALAIAPCSCTVGHFRRTAYTCLQTRPIEKTVSPIELHVHAVSRVFGGL